MRNINRELEFFPRKYHSPQSLTLSDPAFLAAGVEALPVGGWVELDRTTLGSVNDTISVASLPDKRYYKVLFDVTGSGTIVTNFRFNADAGSNYGARISQNGGAEATETGATDIRGIASGTGRPVFGVYYISNLSSAEKLLLGHTVDREAAGENTAPTRFESRGKHTQTSNPIDEIALFNTQSGDFDTGSQLVVLGWDPADVHTNNYWEELASVDLSGGSADVIDSGTFAAKKYLWIQLYINTITNLVSQRITFNSDTGSNYASRISVDGGADGTVTNSTSINNFNDDLVVDSGGFTNLFMINNSAVDKLGIINAISAEAAGAGNFPTRDDGVIKWDNTSSQITKVTFTNTKPGSMGTNSVLKVWGAN